MNYKPLNITKKEQEIVLTALNRMLDNEDYHVKNSTVGRIGSLVIRDIIQRLEHLYPKDKLPKKGENDV